MKKKQALKMIEMCIYVYAYICMLYIHVFIIPYKREAYYMITHSEGLLESS